MFTFILFILSGLALATLALAKRVEMKKRKPVFILVAISKGDAMMRELSHQSLTFYSNGKHRTSFLIKKQLPLRIKSYGHKGVMYIQDLWEERFGTIRNERAIKEPKNISEFFKTIADVEKGVGEIKEALWEEADTLEATTVRVEVREEEVVEAPVAPLKVVKKRAPRRKKLQVVEVE